MFLVVKTNWNIDVGYSKVKILICWFGKYEFFSHLLSQIDLDIDTNDTICILLHYHYPLTSQIDRDLETNMLHFGVLSQFFVDN